MMSMQDGLTRQTTGISTRFQVNLVGGVFPNGHLVEVTSPAGVPDLVVGGDSDSQVPIAPPADSFTYDMGTHTVTAGNGATLVQTGRIERDLREVDFEYLFTMGGMRLVVIVGNGAGPRSDRHAGVATARTERFVSPRDTVDPATYADAVRYLPVMISATGLSGAYKAAKDDPDAAVVRANALSEVHLRMDRHLHAESVGR